MERISTQREQIISFGRKVVPLKAVPSGIKRIFVFQNEDFSLRKKFAPRGSKFFP